MQKVSGTLNALYPHPGWNQGFINRERTSDLSNNPL